MLPEEVLEQLGDRGAALYQEFEQDLIADIARRIKKTGRYTETAELQAKAMMAAGVSPAEIQKEVMKILRASGDYQKEVARNTLEWKKQVKAEIREMRKKAEAEGNDIIANAGDMSFNYDLSLWKQNGEKLTKDSSINRIVSEMSKDTVGTFKNFTKSMGFKGPYSFISIQNAYIRYLDKAVIKMATGTFSFDRAVEDAVREMAYSGLRSVDYASGRTYQLDAAARMCVRTTCHQLSAKMSMRNCENMDTDLVEVSSHWGARPEHALWQGKVYSRSGKNKKYPPFSDCHYGDADGLCGVNCRHTFYPFFEGISETAKWDKEPDPREYNGKTYTYYDMTQKQRQMERNVRATKREIEAQRAIGGEVSALEARKRTQIAEYHRFSKEMGIGAKDNRLRVVKGSSDLNRTQTIKILPKRNESRAMEDKAKSLFDVQPLERGDTVKPVSIYKDLKTSETGKRVLEYIEKNNISVAVIYNRDTITENHLDDVYGLNIGNSIYINARTCNTKKKIVETIIHEETHIEYDIGEDAHAECICDYNAMKHRKGELTGEDIRNIIKSVKERYPDYKWRKP